MAIYTHIWYPLTHIFDVHLHTYFLSTLHSYFVSHSHAYLVVTSTHIYSHLHTCTQKTGILQFVQKFGLAEEALAVGVVFESVCMCVPLCMRSVCMCMRIYVCWSAVQFDGDLSKWDVSSVNDMYGMLTATRALNSDLTHTHTHAQPSSQPPSHLVCIKSIYLCVCVCVCDIADVER